MSSEKQKVGSVLVVGGGIAGMQASLDLTDAGFKVYLVEDGPAIGGRMSQLDKTFPTNDCSMCIMSPRLVDVAGNLNIELLTTSEVVGLDGEAGNFNVKIRKRPRYVNKEKCTGCGNCMENCPVRNKPLFDQEKPEVVLKPEDKQKVDNIIDRYQGKKGLLMPVMQKINAEYNYLPPDVLKYMAAQLGYPLSVVYRIATFYTGFSLKPRGRHIINVCLGTTCYVRGVESILKELQQELNISTGETTKDLKFTIEAVRCLGCCSLAPVITVDGETYGRLKQSDIGKILKEYE